MARNSGHGERHAVDLNAVSPSARKTARGTYRKNMTRGVAGDPMPDFKMSFNSTPAEKIISKSDSYIVLGRDRHAGILSGYGGAGDTFCDSIDIVVGRLGPHAKQFANTVTGDKKQQMYANPHFSTDAARIYVSEKADIDDYLGIKTTKNVSDFNLQLREMGEVINTIAEQSRKEAHLKTGKINPHEVYQSVAKSAVGIKADAVRIIGREGIKLVTRTEAFNSQGGKDICVQGIDLIAGNDPESLQPIVLGKNLKRSLDELADLVAGLGGVIFAFMDAQIDFNGDVCHHTHNSPFFGALTLENPVLTFKGKATTLRQTLVNAKSVENQVKKFGAWKQKFTKPGESNYICSRYNSVN